MRRLAVIAALLLLSACSAGTPGATPSNPASRFQSAEPMPSVSAPSGVPTTLSDARLDPIWAALDAQRAVVNIHPTGSGVCSPLIADAGLAWVNGAPVEDATAVLHLELTTIMLLTTGSFTLVYLLGSAAAIKLLPHGSWSRRGAVVALLSALLLAVSTGASTLWALGVCAAAATYVAVRDRRA